MIDDFEVVNKNLKIIQINFTAEKYRHIKIRFLYKIESSQ